MRKKLILKRIVLFLLLLMIIIPIMQKKEINITKADIVNMKASNSALIDQIKPSDYGKSINYSVTVNGTVLNNWKVFYKDSNHIYIILADYLPNSLVPSAISCNKSGKYALDTSGLNTTQFNTNLKTESIWSDFAKGISNATAVGCPTWDMLTKSFNAKYVGHDAAADYGFNSVETDLLYVPHKDKYEECNGYFMIDSSNLTLYYAIMQGWYCQRW